MKEEGNGQGLIAKVGAVQPLRGGRVLSDVELEQLAHRAMRTKSSAPTTTRPRLRAAAIGAVTLAGALTAALVSVDLTTSAPATLSLGGHHSERVLQLQRGQALSSGRQQVGASGIPMAVVAISYDLIPGPSLSSSAGSESVYRFAWPDNMDASARMLALAFGIHDLRLTPNGRELGGVLVGSIQGAYVDVYPVDGILNWTYQSDSRGGAGLPSSPQSRSSRTIDRHASAEALALLGKIGIRTALGTPVVSSAFNGDTGVFVPVVVNGDGTNILYDFQFAPDGSLDLSNGVLAVTSPIGKYPTIAPVHAVGIASSGTYFVPQEGAPTTCGVSGTPPCDVTIKSASMWYRTFTSVTGTAYLLPTWQLSGDPAGPGAPQFGAWVSAIDQQYVTQSG